MSKFEAQKQALDSRFLEFSLQSNDLYPQHSSQLLSLIDGVRSQIYQMSDKEIIAVLSKNDQKDEFLSKIPDVEIPVFIKFAVLGMVAMFFLEIQKVLKEGSTCTKRLEPPKKEPMENVDDAKVAEYATAAETLVGKNTFSFKELCPEDRNFLRFGIFVGVAKSRNGNSLTREAVEELMDTKAEREAAEHALLAIFTADSSRSIRAFLAYVVGGEVGPGKTRVLRKPDWWMQFHEFREESE